MTLPCEQEENIGYIRATLESLDKRINGSMDVFAKHIEDSEHFREMITKHDVYLKTLGIIMIPVIIYIIKEIIQHIV